MKPLDSYKRKGSIMMKLRPLTIVAAISALLVMLAAICKGLDYFGDIEKNRLVLKLENPSEDKDIIPNGIKFPCYLVLCDGCPVISKDANVTEKEGKGKAGKLDIINLIELPDKKDAQKPDATPGASLEQKKSKVKRTQYLLFEFSKGGWNADKYVTLIKIPFSVDENDKKQMLAIAPEGTIEVQWRDPMNEAVTVVSYWSGMSPPSPVKVTVLESTLGFQNKLGVE